MHSVMFLLDTLCQIVEGDSNPGLPMLTNFTEVPLSYIFLQVRYPTAIFSLLITFLKIKYLLICHVYYV